MIRKIRKKENSSLERQSRVKNWQLLAMLAPGLLAVLIFSYGPMLGICIAFLDYTPARGILGSTFVGLKWFKAAFDNPLFLNAVKNTFIIKGLQTLVGYPFAIILAICLNEIRSKLCKSVVQTVTFLPYFISWAIISTMFKNILGTEGVINELIVSMGGNRVAFLSTPNIFRWIIVFQDTWKWCGYFAIMYLASMTNINPNLYEAAEIDGASRLQKIWHITIPGIKTTMITLAVILIGYLVGGSFEQVFSMYNTSVYSTGDIIETFVYRLGLGSNQYSLATAVGLVQGGVAFLLVTVMNSIMKKATGEGLY